MFPTAYAQSSYDVTRGIANCFGGARLTSLTPGQSGGDLGVLWAQLTSKTKVQDTKYRTGCKDTGYYRTGYKDTGYRIHDRRLVSTLPHFQSLVAPDEQGPADFFSDLSLVLKT